MSDPKFLGKKADEYIPKRLAIFCGGVILFLLPLFFYQEMITTAEKTDSTLGGPSTLSERTEMDVPLVQVHQPQVRDFSSTISLPANVSPWQLVTMYGKVSGYIKSMKFRVGDTVEKGEVMAVIDAPELKVNFAKARDQYRMKALTYKRLLGVWTENPNAIAKQDLDTAAAQAQAAMHLMEKQHALMDYTNIRAPFSGTVTGRFADPGILIQAATGGGTHQVPLYTLMDISRVRVFVSVPQEISGDVRSGTAVTLSKQNEEGWKLDGSITRMTNALDSKTKTLLTEIDLPNKKDELIPGMLLTATFNFKGNPNAVAIPSEAIAQSDQADSHSVFVVQDGPVVKRVAIKTGLKGGDWTEVIAGLTGKEDVIVNKDKIIEGQKVRMKPYLPDNSET